MPDFVYVVMLEEFYADGDEMLNSDIICACESEGDAIKYAATYIQGIVDKLKGLDPDTYGYYRLDDEYRECQMIHYWSDKYNRCIDARIIVVCAPYVKSS